MAHFIRDLQIAVRAAAVLIDPEHTAAVLIVLDVTGRELFRLPIPATVGVVEKPAEPPPVVAGWSFDGGRVLWEGRVLPITGRKLDVLRALVEREVASVDELRKAWDGVVVEESSIRWQIGELRKALKVAFPDYPDDPIAATGAGYRLTIR